MSQIFASLEKTGSYASVLKNIDNMLATKPKALTIILAVNNGITKELLDPILGALSIPVSGGIFPKIIFKDQLLDKGSIVIAWYNEVTITNYKNIENTDSIKDLIGSTYIPNKLKLDNDNTRQNNDSSEYLIFIDGAVSKFEDNIDILYKKVGFRATFSGGGTGSLSLDQTHCIISNEGLLKNAMQTVAINYKTHVTVTHGLQKQSGPHLVTSAKASSVDAINYESAVSFYEKHNGLYRDNNLKPTEFSDYYNDYPIGIENLDGDILVREPIRYNDKSIEYIGYIPEYSKIHMLSGTEDSAREAVDKELNDLKLSDEDNDACFIFSCALRDDADNEGESKEIKMLNKHLRGSKHIIGALSMGEIATSQSRLLQLHNKSIVITRLRGEL